MNRVVGGCGGAIAGVAYVETDQETVSIGPSRPAGAQALTLVQRLVTRSQHLALQPPFRIRRIFRWNFRRVYSHSVSDDVSRSAGHSLPGKSASFRRTCLAYQSGDDAADYLRCISTWGMDSASARTPGNDGVELESRGQRSGHHVAAVAAGVFNLRRRGRRTRQCGSAAFLATSRPVVHTASPTTASSSTTSHTLKHDRPTLLKQICACAHHRAGWACEGGVTL